VTSPPELAEQFAAIFPAVAEAVPDLAEQLATKPVSSIPLIRCDPWVWAGNVALIGDSCHAMAPFMGQGMNCAFEDARTLATSLDETSNWPRALAAYEQRRKSNGEAIAEISLEHYRTMSRMPGSAEDEAITLTERLQALLPDRFPALYERCAFSDDSYAAARADDLRLKVLVRDLLNRYGTELAAVPDNALTGIILRHGGRDDSPSVPVALQR
jgi:kynurenine 3-monooxygenase